MNQLEILVSTYQSKLYQNKDQVQQLKNCKHIVVDQSPEIEAPQDLRVLTLEGRGLTKSRNFALQSAKGDICLISDDDLSYVRDFESKITQAFDLYPEVSLITFKIITPEGTPYKNYRASSYTHTTRTSISISSVEIAFRRKDILTKNIKFDERFGVNGLYPCGEEAVFINDCLKSGLKAIYLPIYICVHPNESSGKDFSGDKYLFAKGAMIRRLYGFVGVIMLFAYMVKNSRKILKSNGKVLELFQGFFSVR